ncbi:MAG TPA: response regulator [Actinomycetota bacterium]|nr:response regulator [Actinomycetota bacterium]
MRKLLIADDEEGVRALVRMTLESDDYEILEASDGEEALRLARSELPQLVLLDVTMPELDGFEVCKALKGDAATSHIAVVLLTARTQKADQAKAAEVQADDYFTKPFSPVALLSKVDEVLGAP